MRRREAYIHTYAVFSFKGDDQRHVLTTPNTREAWDAAKAADWGEVRVVYSCRVPLFKSNRYYVCGSTETLRRLDEKARTR